MTDVQTPEVVDMSDVAWTDICSAASLQPERGVAALVDGHPVAVFLVGDGDIYAVDHIDPLSDTPTMARGIVGSVDGRPTIAAPLLKERYDLATGERVDGDGPALQPHDARIREGRVEVRANVMPAKSS